MFHACDELRLFLDRLAREGPRFVVASGRSHLLRDLEGGLTGIRKLMERFLCGLQAGIVLVRRVVGLDQQKSDIRIVGRELDGLLQRCDRVRTKCPCRYCWPSRARTLASPGES